MYFPTKITYNWGNIQHNSTSEKPDSHTNNRSITKLVVSLLISF